MVKLSEDSWISVGLMVMLLGFAGWQADLYFTTKANAQDLKELQATIQVRRDLNIEFQKQVLQDLSRIKERLKIGEK